MSSWSARIFTFNQDVDQPVGARCSVHPGSRGGGAVYVDLSIFVVIARLECANRGEPRGAMLERRSAKPRAKLWCGEVVRAWRMTEAGRAGRVPGLAGAHPHRDYLHLPPIPVYLHDLVQLDSYSGPFSTSALYTSSCLADMIHGLVDPAIRSLQLQLTYDDAVDHHLLP